MSSCLVMAAASSIVRELIESPEVGRGNLTGVKFAVQGIAAALVKGFG